MRLKQSQFAHRTTKQVCAQLVISTLIIAMWPMTLATAGTFAATRIGSAISATALTEIGTNTPTPASEPSSGTPSLAIADPAVPISVDKTLAIPGDTLTFTLNVTNDGNASAPNVMMTDNLPAQLQVVAVSSTQGTFTVDGGTVIFVIGTVNPYENVTLKVVTKVSSSVIPPMAVSNSGVLTWPGGAPRSSNTVSVRITRGELPSTGEHPDETPQSLTWIIIAGVLVGGIVFTARHSRRNVRE